MSKDTKQKGLFIAVVISALILLAAVIWAGMKRSESQEIGMNQHQGHDHEHGLVEEGQGIARTLTDSDKTEKLTLKQIEQIALKSRMWGAYYNEWFGKDAPDFTLTDINGKEHSLSDYKGKEVMLVFWATWCGPCRLEIPHLIELRKSISEEKLAILAISSESEDVVKDFVSSNKLNYDIFATQAVLPAPYSSVPAIPSSFFVNSEGKIKFGTMGTIDLNAMNAIIQADE
ncbi:MAG: peroxiredoxin family protein [Planctomycetota bacterium]|jgi:thiol-disulfide isomerase/thioredoxin